MISCSHWGLFQDAPSNTQMANTSFHQSMMLANLANQANSINQMYQNLYQGYVTNGQLSGIK